MSKLDRGKNESVGRGRDEIHSGQGKIVAEDDDFFEVIREEIRKRA